MKVWFRFLPKNGLHKIRGFGNYYRHRQFSQKELYMYSRCVFFLTDASQEVFQIQKAICSVFCIPVTVNVSAFCSPKKISARTVINQLTWTGWKKNSWWARCVFFPWFYPTWIWLKWHVVPFKTHPPELLAIWISPLKCSPCAVSMASVLLILGDTSSVKSWWRSRSGSRKDGDWWVSGKCCPRDFIIQNCWNDKGIRKWNTSNSIRCLDLVDWRNLVYLVAVTSRFTAIFLETSSRNIVIFSWFGTLLLQR